MMDECKNCIARGKVAECMATPCTKHENSAPRRKKRYPVRLKRCPFCGGKNVELWPMDGFKSPVCLRCGATINENFITGKSTEKQIKAWNTRIENDYIYIVQAYRYGNKRGYNFPVGAFDAENLAIQWACAHASNRGGKYAHVVCKCKLNQAYDAEDGVIVFDSCGVEEKRQ